MKFGLILLLAVIAVPAIWPGGSRRTKNDLRSLDNRFIIFDMGAGPVVVLLHGLGSHKEDWLAGDGADGAEIQIAGSPTRSGFGRSDKPLLD